MGLAVPGAARGDGLSFAVRMASAMLMMLLWGRMGSEPASIVWPTVHSQAHSPWCKKVDAYPHCTQAVEATADSS
jgi:hypothetical protein